MFGRASISDYYRHIENQFNSQILSHSSPGLNAKTPEELIEAYLKDNGLNAIELDPDSKESAVPQKYIKRIPAHQRDRSYQNEGDLDYECERILVTMPIKENRSMAALRKLSA